MFVAVWCGAVGALYVLFISVTMDFNPELYSLTVGFVRQGRATLVARRCRIDIVRLERGVYVYIPDRVGR